MRRDRSYQPVWLCGVLRASTTSASGRVSRAWPVQTATRNCTRDEGGPFGFGNQVPIPSHCKLLRSRAVVVSVAVKSGQEVQTARSREALTLAERLCRTADRIDPARVFGPCHRLGRGTSAPDSEKLCGLLQPRIRTPICLCC